MSKEVVLSDSREYRCGDLAVIHTVQVVWNGFGAGVFAGWELYKDGKRKKEARNIYIGGLWRLREYLNKVDRNPFGCT